jgi:hypothetical protein
MPVAGLDALVELLWRSMKRRLPEERAILYEMKSHASKFSPYFMTINWR